MQFCLLTLLSGFPGKHLPGLYGVTHISVSENSAAEILREALKMLILLLIIPSLISDLFIVQSSVELIGSMHGHLF